MRGLADDAPIESGSSSRRRGEHEWVATTPPGLDGPGRALPVNVYPRPRPPHQDLRSTFASNALAAGVRVFELARIMGTSVGMIEAHYGALIDTAHDAILSRLENSMQQFGS